MNSYHELLRQVKILMSKQEGNSNIDCIPCAGKPRSAHPRGGGGGLISQNALQFDYISMCKPAVLPFDKR